MESRLRSRIAALTEAQPALADAFAVRGATIELVDRAEIDPGELRLPAELVRARLGAGVPLLDRFDLPLPSGIGVLVERLAVALAADAALGQDARALLAALRDHRLHAEQLVGESVVGHTEHLAALAAGVGLPVAPVASVADLAARAVLSAVARRLAPALKLAPWTRVYCPICGGRPVLAEAAGALRCGRCATAWAWDGQTCPDCPSGRLVGAEPRSRTGGAWGSADGANDGRAGRADGGSADGANDGRAGRADGGLAGGVDGGLAGAINRAPTGSTDVGARFIAPARDHHAAPARDHHAASSGDHRSATSGNTPIVTPTDGPAALSAESPTAPLSSVVAAHAEISLRLCDACPAYLKVWASPRADRLAELLLDDLASWPLDREALERGSARRVDLGYRLEHGDIGGEDLDDD